MYRWQIYLKLGKVISASILMLVLGIQQGEARDKRHDFLPLADGWILDQSPFDGIGDENGIEDQQLVTVTLNSGIVDIRGVMEFDVRHLKGRRIKSAFLKIVPLGIGSLPGTVAIPVQLFGYRGNGSLQTDDFNDGCFVTVFDGSTASNNVPIDLDVTEFLQRVPKRFVGFSLRTNVHGAQLNFGSLENGPAPTLTVIVD